jgi:hypothetical protein
MPSAVVGVFDAYFEAQGTVKELISSGFTTNDIKLSEGDGEVLPAAKKSARPGKTFVVTALADDDTKSELASEVMKHHHPVDIDERTDPERYRAHWEENYSRLGGSYEDYAAAYEYGELASASEIFEDRTWDQIERKLRIEWENRYPDNAWDHFKEPVHHGYSKRKPARS